MRDLYLKWYYLPKDDIDVIKATTPYVEVREAYNNSNNTACVLVDEFQLDILNLNYDDIEIAYESWYGLNNPDILKRIIIDKKSMWYVCNHAYLFEGDAINEMVPFFEELVQDIPRDTKLDMNWMLTQNPQVTGGALPRDALVIATFLWNIKNFDANEARLRNVKMLNNVAINSEYLRVIQTKYDVTETMALLRDINWAAQVNADRSRRNSTLLLLSELPNTVMTSYNMNALLHGVSKQQLENNVLRGMIKLFHLYSVNYGLVARMIVNNDDYIAGSDVVGSYDDREGILTEITKFDHIIAIKIARELKLEKETMQSLFKDHPKDLKRITDF